MLERFDQHITLLYNMLERFDQRFDIITLLYNMLEISSNMLDVFERVQKCWMVFLTC